MLTYYLYLYLYSVKRNTYDIFLNEEIPINVDYINKDIEIDCNKVFK